MRQLQLRQRALGLGTAARHADNRSGASVDVAETDGFMACRDESERAVGMP
jgi:hypothetical protein